MSVLTYMLFQNGFSREAIGMASWLGEKPSFLGKRGAAGRILAEVTAEGRSFESTFVAADAIDWFTVS